MEIIVSHERARVDITVLELIGMLNLGSTARLDKTARDEYDNGMRYLLIDISQLDSITSAGLRSIHQIYKMLQSESTAEDEAEEKQQSPYLKLLNPQPQISRVLNISGFDVYIPIYEDRQEAINSF